MSKKRTIWEQLLRKKSASISLLLLFLAVMISSLAYLHIPDNTPNSNTQFLELALKPPGFETSFLLAPREHIVDNSYFFSKIISGSHSKNEKIPFKKIELKNDFVELLTYDGSNRLFPITSFTKMEISQSQFLDKYVEKGTFYLGTDKYGRDIYSRLILGIRLSIFIGFMAVILSLLIGIFIGASGGYYGGKIDGFIMYLINITWSIPTLLLVFAIVLALGRGMAIIFIAIGLTLWVDVARIVRGQVLKVKEEEYITAAKSLSFSTFRVITKHILPNIMGPLLVIAATNFAVAILIEAGLSYLGFGIQPPIPSVGNMLHENYGYAITGKPFLALVPAITIMLLVLAFNLVGSGLRDIVDVKNLD